jgi:thiamine biosynthesis lipoprotein
VTGLPAESSLRSVTVVAENSAVADILSTSFFVMGEDEAVHFLENCTGIDAYFVDEQNVVRKYLSK